MKYRTIGIDDRDYPDSLKEIPSAPKKIYSIGELPKKELLSVAIVGARQCSNYGRSLARELGAALAACHVQVISGMARGIDAAAQKGALEGGGRTFAVLGSGVDVCYPKEYLSLYERIQNQGGILSEQPPGMQPLPQFFPARNRIISGLADVVVVIEAKTRSGSLITADHALEQGKDVYALPGPVNSNLSTGCNRLIKQGAGVIVSIEDFLEELHLSDHRKPGNARENKFLLESEENLVYTCLDLYPKSIEQISDETGMGVSGLTGVLMGLELKGYIQEISKNYYVKCK